MAFTVSEDRKSSQLRTPSSQMALSFLEPTDGSIWNVWVIMDTGCRFYSVISLSRTSRDQLGNR